jgi:hypothetical protein
MPPADFIFIGTGCHMDGKGSPSVRFTDLELDLAHDPSVSFKEPY